MSTSIRSSATFTSAASTAPGDALLVRLERVPGVLGVEARQRVAGSLDQLAQPSVTSSQARVMPSLSWCAEDSSRWRGLGHGPVLDDDIRNPIEVLLVVRDHDESERYGVSGDPAIIRVAS